MLHSVTMMIIPAILRSSIQLPSVDLPKNYTMATPLKQKLLQLFQLQPDASTNILTELKGNRLWISYNRPKRFNAVTVDMVSKLTKIVTDANADQRVKFIVFRGNGGNFTSGNDFNNFMIFNSMGDPLEDIVKISTDLLHDFTKAIIHSKKPLFAITEGKAIGFGFTQLMLYDRVFAVEGGEFSAPLILSAQGPEMCCSFTFPKRFGQSLGEHLIVSGERVDAAFLEKHGVVTVCKSVSEAEKRLEEHLNELDGLNWPSYIAARELFRDIDLSTLDKVNRAQSSNLFARMTNPQLIPFLMNFLSKSKAKGKAKL